MGNCLQSFKRQHQQRQEQEQQLSSEEETEEQQQQEDTVCPTGEGHHSSHRFALLPSFLSYSFSSSSLPNICPHPKHWLRSYLENYIFWQLQDWRARFCKREYLYVIVGTLATEIVVYLVLHGPRRVWISSSSSSSSSSLLSSHWVCHCKPQL